MKKLFSPLLIILYSTFQFSYLQAQNNIGIGTTTPNAKALLDLTASDKGLLVPRVTTTQRIAINPVGNADASLLVYDTNDSLFYFWNSAQWVPFPQQGGSNNISLNFDANTGVLSLTDNGGTLTTNIPPDNDSDPNNELITNVVFNANGNILTINEGGNIWSTTISIVDPDSDPANEYNTALSFNSNTNILSVTDAGGSINTDLSSLSNNWKLLGNAGTNPATNFLGTTDNQDLVFRTNNTEKVRVLSNGNVGIGTVSPVSRLHVNNGGIDVTNTGNAYMVFDGGISNSPGSQISFIDFKLNGLFRGNIAVNEASPGVPLELNSLVPNDVALVIGGGRVGIGTHTPVAKLEVVAGGAGTQSVNITSPLSQARFNNYDADQTTSFDISGLPGSTSRLFSIHSSNVNQGSAFGGKLFEVYGHNGAGNIIALSVLNNGTVGVGTQFPDQVFSVNGNASKAGGGTWATFSDRRVKNDIQTFNDGLNVVLKLNPVTFRYNEKSGYTDLLKSYVGFIAQDVEQVAPYMVDSYDDVNGPSGLADKRQFDESALTKILVNALKELNGKVDQLTKENIALRNSQVTHGDFDKLKAEIQYLKDTLLKAAK